MPVGSYLVKLSSTPAAWDPIIKILTWFLRWIKVTGLTAATFIIIQWANCLSKLHTL